MTLTFVDTYNMIAYLTKSDASKGFTQIIDFLNGSSIKYALTVNPNIYVSCIKQFWTAVAVKKVNDVTRLQALVDKKRVIITEATIRDVLHLDDAKGIECLPNEEIFTELARMGYKKPSTKLTFYKAFFSSKWKFLIHTILQCISAKRTSWNGFSSSMASAVIYLSTGRKFNFSKYIFDSLVRNVDSSTKFYMYPCFLKLMIRAQVGDLSSHTTKYSSPSLTQKVFANMRMVGKGCSRVETPLFEGMIVKQQVVEGVTKVNVKDVSTAGVTTEGVVSVADDEVPAAVDEPSIPSPTPPTPPPQPSQDQPLTSHDVAVDAKDGQDAEMEESLDVQGRQLESQAQIYQIDLEHTDKVLSMQDVDIEPAELQEVVEVVTTAKLITEVVTAASATITVAALTLTTAPSAARRRKGVVIRDPQETATPSTIIHSKAKSKGKGKGILVEEPKPLKKQAQIEQDEAYARKLEAELNKNIDWDEVIDHVQRKHNEDNAGMAYDDIRPIFEKNFNSNMAFQLKTKEKMDEEDSKALKRLSESQYNKTAKKQKLDKEVAELKRHLQIVPNDDDDVYTKATPLTGKVPVVDYEIYTENNKPYYKIIRADGSPQLFLSFLSLLRNFDREGLEVLWELVKERFASSKPKNFSDDFLLTTLAYMFEKLDVQAQVWKNQRPIHGLAKVKS
nr:hypothetical protein [Tanacetum cinerariifolium]